MKSDYLFKIVIGGAGRIGKTTLLYRYMHGSFKEDTRLTIDVEFHTEFLEYNGKKISLSLWDLGGQERFRFLQPQYVKGAKAGIVFFDMSNLSTISQINEWVDLFRNNASPSIPIVLGGTKLDCIDPSEEPVINDRAMEIVTELGLDCYVPTSSKSGTNVKEIITKTVDVIFAKTK